MGLAAATAGELLVRLPDGAGTVAAELRRPQALVGALTGRPVGEFLSLLPLLFPLCGLAHGVAALRAVEAAEGVVANSAHQHAREVITRADAVAMHVWRTALDWAEALGDPGDARPVAAARRIAQALPARFYPDGDWLEPGGGHRAAAVDLASEIAELGALVSALDLPVRQRAMLRAVESRVGAPPLLCQRLAARFVEQVARFEHDLAALLALVGGRVSAPGHGSREDRAGRGEVETARGPLVYWIAVAEGRVESCRSSAPTDVAFAPGSEALASFALLAGAESQPAARLVAAAYDPCVPVRFEREGGARA